jgi:hypothetical protein
LEFVLEFGVEGSTGLTDDSGSLSELPDPDPELEGCVLDGAQ